MPRSGLVNQRWAADQQIVSTVYATELMPKTTSDTIDSALRLAAQSLHCYCPWQSCARGFGFAAMLNESR